MVEQRPRFSVVIPAWNEQDYIPECLESIRHQTFKGSVEVIVVDNNSTDDTSAVAAEHGAKVVFEPAQGVCKARQAGTEVATGEIVVSTDADTIFAHDWLERIDRYYTERPDIVGTVGGCHFVGAPWWCEPYEKTLFGGVNLYWKRFGRVVYGSAANLSFKRDVWPGYNTKLTQGGDEFDFIRRLQDIGPMSFTYENPVFTSSRRLRKGLLYTIFMTVFYHYLFTYWVNRLTGREVLGMSPPFRDPRDVVHEADAGIEEWSDDAPDERGEALG